MSFQISHLVLGIEGYKNFCNKKEKDFFIGNNFPDIRFITNQKREDTHFLSLNDLKFLDTDTSFMSGYRFHLLTDLIQREYYIKNNYLFLKYGGFEKIKTPLIFLEDILFFNKIDNIKKYILFFDDVLNDEMELKIEKEKIIQWHKIIKQYFSSKKLNEEDIKKFRSNFIIYNENEFNEQLEMLNILKKDSDIIELINNFYSNFNEEIKKYI